MQLEKSTSNLFLQIRLKWQEKKELKNVMAPRPLCTHFSCKVKMTKYNTLNLHGHIFTAVQNSQYFIKSTDFHLGLWILRSKAPFGPEQSGMICWNWFKMSAEVH